MVIARNLRIVDRCELYMCNERVEKQQQRVWMFARAGDVPKLKVRLRTRNPARRTCGVAMEVVFVAPSLSPFGVLRA